MCIVGARRGVYRKLTSGRGEFCGQFSQQPPGPELPLAYPQLATRKGGLLGTWVEDKHKEKGGGKPQKAPYIYYFKSHRVCDG